MPTKKSDKRILKLMIWFLLIVRSASDWFDKRRRLYES